MSYTKKRVPGKKNTPDEIVSGYNRMIEWSNRNVNLIVYAGGAVLFAAFIILGVVWLKESREKAASEALTRAMTAYLSVTEAKKDAGDDEIPSEALKELLEVFEGVILEYPGCTQSQYAYLFAANILYRLGRYGETVRTVETLIDDNPEFARDVRAEYLLARAYESMEKYDRATAVYSEFMERSSGELKVMVMMDMARCFQFSGDHKGATDIYREILAEHKDSVFTLKAEKKLATMGIWGEEKL